MRPRPVHRTPGPNGGGMPRTRLRDVDGRARRPARRRTAAIHTRYDYRLGRQRERRLSTTARAVRLAFDPSFARRVNAGTAGAAPAGTAAACTGRTRIDAPSEAW